MNSKHGAQLLPVVTCTGSTNSQGTGLASASLPASNAKDFLLDCIQNPRGQGGSGEWDFKPSSTQTGSI